jgi:4-aminobutyrate aminotransferase
MYKCLENGLSFKVSQGNVIQLSPPLVITRSQLQEALGIVERAIGSVKV